DALLDQRLRLVGGEYARTGDDLALAVGLERGQLQVEEARRRAVEQDERELARAEGVQAGSRQVHAERVAEEVRLGNDLIGLEAGIGEAAADCEARAVLAEDAMARQAGLVDAQARAKVAA